MGRRSTFALIEQRGRVTSFAHLSASSISARRVFGVFSRTTTTLAHCRHIERTGYFFPTSQARYPALPSRWFTCSSLQKGILTAPAPRIQ
jgi:hypothetical protein